MAEESSGQRNRGRPSRRVADSGGRDRLLEAARALMRKNAHVKLHRRQIAEEAKLAPALVTYYFDDEKSLIDAAALPIIEVYLSRLSDTVIKRVDAVAGLHHLILLLIEISRDNGQLIDTYIRYTKQTSSTERPNFRSQAYELISQYIELLQGSFEIRRLPSAFVATFIWGICKTVAQLPELGQFVEDELAQNPVSFDDFLAEMIVDILLHGLKSRS